MNNLLFFSSYFELIIAESAAKKYSAEWLKDSNATVYRDSQGRFATNSSSDGDTSEASASIQQQIVDKINSATTKAINKLTKVSRNFRHELTEAYRKHELRLEVLVGHKMETSIQDKLIQLKLLEERNIVEEMGDAIRSPEEAKKFYDKHNAEMAAIGTAIALNSLLLLPAAATSVFGLALLDFVLTGTEFTSVSVIAEAIFTAFQGASTKIGVDKYYENHPETSAFKRFVTESMINSILVMMTHSSFRGSRKEVMAMHSAAGSKKSFKTPPSEKSNMGVHSDPQTPPKNPQVIKIDVLNDTVEYGDEQIAALESQFPHLLKILGLNKAPKNLEELKGAYFKMAEQVHPARGGTDEEYKMLSEAYSQIIKIITKGKTS